jgi:hypothetical protein
MEADSDTHRNLHEHFKDQPIFIEVVDTLLGLNTNTSEQPQMSQTPSRRLSH